MYAIFPAIAAGFMNLYQGNMPGIINSLSKLADASGIIYISLVKGTDPYIQLTIADNGPGLPPGFNINKVESLGINLMRGLSKQLGGSFDVLSEQGCTVNITFKAEIFNSGITKVPITLT